MKIASCLLFLLSVALVAGCGDAANQTVTDGADPQALADYEADLASVTGQDLEEELEKEAEEENPEE